MNQNFQSSSPAPPNFPQASNLHPFIAPFNIPPPPPIIQTSYQNLSNLPSPAFQVLQAGPSPQTYQSNPESPHSSKPYIKLSNEDPSSRISSLEGKISYFLHNYQFKTLNFTLDNAEYPTTISKFWIPIENMKNLYRFNQNFIKNVEFLKIKHNIAAWKRSRGDGNCYFRAVISTYFDNIHKPWHSISLLKSFKNLLKKHKLLAEGYEEYEKSKENVLQKVKESIKLKESKSYEKAYMLCTNLLQDEKFDIDLIMVSRYLTVCTLIDHKDDPNISPYIIDGMDGVINDMLCLGKEGGDLTLMILPMCLGVQVVQFMFLEKESMVKGDFPYEVLEQAMQINVIRREGHYDILYTRQELEYDMCCLKDGTFTYVESEEYYKVLKNRK